MLEIERKFLVEGHEYRDLAHRSYRIVQGFLNRDPKRTVRVRLQKDSGWLTVKGLSSDDGTSRFEWEQSISGKDAAALLELCEPGIVAKSRYEVYYRGHRFEVDEFEGDNEGLVIAELELEHADDRFECPDWIAKEITGEVKYYNSQLSISPFKTWSNP